MRGRGLLKHFYSRLISPWLPMPLYITTNKEKWVAVEGDQNASITTQLVKQKAKWAAIEDDNHNASITTHIKKIESNARTTKLQSATKSKNNTRTTALERSA